MPLICLLGVLAAACGSEPSVTRPGQRPGIPVPPGSQLPTPAPRPTPSAAGSGGGVDNPIGVVPIGPAAGGDGSCNQDVDIVFVLDVSGSMIPPLTTLEREVGLVDEALKGKNLPSPPHYGLVVFVDDLLVMKGGMPYADVVALKADVAAQRELTNLNAPRQVAGQIDNLTWPENSLDALFAAANQFQWRPADKTLRTIILVTDASFWDLTVPSSGHASEQNLLFPAHASMHGYDEVIAALRAQKIWVNTFAAKTGGPPDGMVSPPSHGEFRGTSVNVGIGFFEPYGGRPTIAQSTGGFAWDVDEVFDGKISLANPINQSIEALECAPYPS